MRTILTAGLLLAGLTGGSLAQDETDFQAWMKTAGGSTGALKKALDAKAGDDAVAAAKKLESVFTQVEAFWTNRQADDAVKYSRDARAAATELASVAEQGGDPSAALAGLGATCKGCHATHREQAADGSWKIK